MILEEEQQSPTEREQLATRHVFLDTSIYRELGFDLANALLRVLGRHITNARLCLHITDITLAEIERQIHEQAATMAREMDRTRKRLKRWRSRAPDVAIPVPEELPSDLGKSAFGTFKTLLKRDWKATEHTASKLPAGPVFERYFRRQAPFDEQNSKEFPDAFAIAALEQWCARTTSTIYVVTQDKAMQRAASQSDALIRIGLEDLLQKATSIETPESVDKVRRFLDSPQFLAAMENGVRTQIGSINIIYDGDLVDGEAYDAEVAGSPAVKDFSVVSVSASRIEALVDAEVPLRVYIEHDDISIAIYDREDDVYHGARPTETIVEDNPWIKLLITFHVSNDAAPNVEVLNQDVYVSEPYEDYK